MDAVVAALSDLSSYPEWNDLVADAEPTSAIADDPGPAWSTTLRARVGPFARAKRLRFVRELEISDGSTSICFRRREVDGRDHAAWVMRSDVSTGQAGQTDVVLELSYDGELWSSALDPVLSAAISRSTRRLPQYLADQPG